MNRAFRDAAEVDTIWKNQCLKKWYGKQNVPYDVTKNTIALFPKGIYDPEWNGFTLSEMKHLLK